MLTSLSAQSAPAPAAAPSPGRQLRTFVEYNLFMDSLIVHYSTRHNIVTKTRLATAILQVNLPNSQQNRSDLPRAIFMHRCNQW